MSWLSTLAALRRGLALVAAWSPIAVCAAGGTVPLDPWPKHKLQDQAALQSGLRTYMNYCAGCHAQSSVRYFSLQSLGLDKKQIEANLILGGGKISDTINNAMSKNDAKAWFGVVPPDLSVIGRARGGDWLYTYLRGFYRDSARQSGWNNLVFANVGMPHVLHVLQGEQVLVEQKETDKSGAEHVIGRRLELAQPGEMTRAAYDNFVGDLVAYLVYIGEPHQVARKKIGIVVLFALVLIFFVVYPLKRAYWADLH
jgi:ubiquinol-cytochrome c reductase cytochrome c1 subunit